MVLKPDSRGQERSWYIHTTIFEVRKPRVKPYKQIDRMRKCAHQGRMHTYEDRPVSLLARNDCRGAYKASSAGVSRGLFERLSISAIILIDEHEMALSLILYHPGRNRLIILLCVRIAFRFGAVENPYPPPFFFSKDRRARLACSND